MHSILVCAVAAWKMLRALEKKEMLLKKFVTSGWAWLWISVLVLGIDRWAKLWVLDNIAPYSVINVLPFFDLTLAFNKGAAFSFLHSTSAWSNILLGGLAVVVSSMIIVWLYRISARERLLAIGLCFILGGALGNLCDRILYAHVVDFFSFYWGEWHFAIFNIADAAICLGSFILFLVMITNHKI